MLTTTEREPAEHQHTLRLQRARPLAVEFMKPALFINTSRLGVRVKHLQEEGKSRNALAGIHSLCAKLLCLKTSEGASERRSFLDLELGNLQVLMEENADILCKCIAQSPLQQASFSTPSILPADVRSAAPPFPLLNSSSPSPHGSTQQYRHPLKEGEGKQTDVSYVMCSHSILAFPNAVTRFRLLPHWITVIRHYKQLKGGATLVVMVIS